MAVPERIKPSKLSDYLDVLTRAVFQAGMTWSQIENKWSVYRQSFDNFEPDKVAHYDDADVERLMNQPGVLHSKKKIDATIYNARELLRLDKEHSGFANYLRSKKSYEELSKDIQKKFKYVGELSVYYFLFRVSEPVPDFDIWVKTIAGEHPRMKEMVEAAKGF